MTADRQMLVRTAKDLKEAYLAQVAAVRSIERSLAIAHFGDADHTQSCTSPAYSQARPDVSVVVPVYNQGSFLIDAIDSVVACAGADHPSIELIVVDDHSTDDSLTLAQHVLDDREWLPWLLVGRAANGGPSAARNTGFAHARAPYVFALDADNVLYPNGLRVLAERLDASPESVVAAYGLLERFDETGALGLTSHLPWDADLLVIDGYIDTMALFRRQACSDLGGFAEPTGVGGWEGYDLWLSAAERGWRADLVTQVVGRYREHPGSMSTISNIDQATNFVALRERHPRLAWPS
jgi:glycosyltransferase involved in cell wall biosynthesis